MARTGVDGTCSALPDLIMGVCHAASSANGKMNKWQAQGGSQQSAINSDLVQPMGCETCSQEWRPVIESTHAPKEEKQHSLLPKLASPHLKQNKIWKTLMRSKNSCPQNSSIESEATAIGGFLSHSLPWAQHSKHSFQSCSIPISTQQQPHWPLT